MTCRFGRFDPALLLPLSFVILPLSHYFITYILEHSTEDEYFLFNQSVCH